MIYVTLLELFKNKLNKLPCQKWGEGMSSDFFRGPIEMVKWPLKKGSSPLTLSEMPSPKHSEVLSHVSETGSHQ